MNSYSYKKITRKLKKLGFRFYRQGKGSHTLWVNDERKKIIPVPNHGNKDIRSGTLRAIIKQIGLKNINELDEV